MMYYICKKKVLKLDTDTGYWILGTGYQSKLLLGKN